MSPRLLIICPHFPPTNAADGHRIRICAAGLISRGWQLDVLCCEPDDLPINQSPRLVDTLPSELTIHRVPCRPTLLGRVVGASTTSRNARRFVQRRGDELLARGDYVGVLFSTTAFGLLPLGLRWRQRFGVDFVIDLQDPWLQRLPDGVSPPGGTFRYGLAMAQAKRWEPAVTNTAAGIVCVSPNYESQLKARYPGLTDKPFLVLPFGAAANDFHRAAGEASRQNFFDGQSDQLQLVHVGRGGEDLWPSLRPLLEALQASNTPSHLHLIGTSYAPAGRQRASLLPLAEAAGFADSLSEYPARVDYFLALRCLSESAGIVVLTSSDAAYNASKIHNCVLAGPPVLALVHDGSVAQRLWQGLAPQLTLIDCASPDAVNAIGRWLEQLPAEPVTLEDYPFEADHQAEALSSFLSAVLSPADEAGTPRST
ncbi:MAG: hypothetical protein AAF358_14090 [Pseudomonadota bacterium]